MKSSKKKSHLFQVMKKLKLKIHNLLLSYEKTIKKFITSGLILK